jgi:two-component system response regulator AtoC
MNTPTFSETTTELLGDSPAMVECRRLLRCAARGNATVLLRGETGTGKELAARAVHRHSERQHRPFVRIHCAALPDTLLESELFGHEPGAFTGAMRRKAGRIEAAEGGTVFLDEIGDVTPAVQVKLLHLLQERSYSPLGGTASVAADVRFVAATHRDLEAMVRAGDFREDLFYRLNVVPIWCPPLRERSGDVELLARSFVAQMSAQHRFSARALQRLAVRPWPGNVRELRNLVERLVVLNEDPLIDEVEVQRALGATLGPARDQRADDPGDNRLAVHMSIAEKRALQSALRRAGGNRALAARMLGISRRTLYTKLDKLGLR